jgi:hypothetical protein
MCVQTVVKITSGGSTDIYESVMALHKKVDAIMDSEKASRITPRSIINDANIIYGKGGFDSVYLGKIRIL